MAQVRKKVSELARPRGEGLFQTSGLLNILGFSTHFPADNIMEQT